MTSARVFAVILAGGSGTRFWPASRTVRPKQLLALTGRDAMLVETAARVLSLAGGWEGVLVAGGTATAEATRALLPDLPAENLLVEPCPRNTAPCIGWATAVIARTDPEAIVVVLPSDHHISNLQAFHRSLSTAIDSARSGTITTLGIRPTRPETGFGYIETAAPDEVTVARAFVEKPGKEAAERYVAGGRHLWNSGMFVFRASDMLDAFRHHLPDAAATLARFDAAARAGKEAEEVRDLYGAMPSVSIDVGIMERLDRIAVVRADFGWSDVGSWQAAWELADKDSEGNTLGADVLAIDARRNHVVDAREHGSKKLIALLGVDDLVVVETDDALLIVPRERSQEVRAIIERLRASRSELL